MLMTYTKWCTGSHRRESQSVGESLGRRDDIARGALEGKIGLRDEADDISLT